MKDRLTKDEIDHNIRDVLFKYSIHFQLNVFDALPPWLRKYYLALIGDNFSRLYHQEACCGLEYAMHPNAKCPSPSHRDWRTGRRGTPGSTSSIHLRFNSSPKGSSAYLRLLTEASRNAIVNALVNNHLEQDKVRRPPGTSQGLVVDSDGAHDVAHHQRGQGLSDIISAP
jgi:hypothetical protein